jgi:hypothetical protein
MADVPVIAEAGGLAALFIMCLLAFKILVENLI